jgi:pimeloyl-ACP methyl ester carboxylesterase
MTLRHQSALILGISLAFALPWFNLPVFAQQNASPAVDQTLLPYASTKDSAHLPGGRIIHLVCMGQGHPVVILTAGGGGWSIAWNKVQPAVAARTRTCTWDRAGFGLSGPSPKPQTVDNTTTDLVAALKAGGTVGPYVLVGHSAGAYESLLFADQQPSAVAGMVLVDPSIPDQKAIFDRVTPAQVEWLRVHGNDSLVGFLQKCVDGLRTGKIRRGGPDPDGCLGPITWPPTYPQALRATLDKLLADYSLGNFAAAMETYASYTKSIDLDSNMVINPQRNYGNMPLIVLTASEYLSPPDFPAAAKAEIPQFHAEWERAHDAYAALSTRGVNRTVAGSSHDIPQIKPQAVIDAIDEVVSEVRASVRTKGDTRGGAP